MFATIADASSDERLDQELRAGADRLKSRAQFLSVRERLELAATLIIVVVLAAIGVAVWMLVLGGDAGPAMRALSLL